MATEYRDPVCKCDLDEKPKYKCEYEGKEVYFCSPECKEKFEKNPHGLHGGIPSHRGLISPDLSRVRVLTMPSRILHTIKQL